MFLLLAEVGVRKGKVLERRFGCILSRVNSIVIPSSNASLGYVLKANFRGHIRPKESETSKTIYHINSWGLRGDEPKIGKNIVNIVVIGDSMSFGLGVDEGFVYSNILKTKLNRWAEENGRDEEYEVYNCSVPGYNSEQEYLFCKDIVEKTNPKIIIWQYCYNDILGPMRYAFGNLIWHFEQRFPSHLLLLLKIILIH